MFSISTKAKAMVFQSDDKRHLSDTLYVYDPDNVTGLIGRHDVKRINVFEENSDFDGDYNFYVFWMMDQFDSSMYIENGQSEQDAYDGFVNTQGQLGHYIIDDNDPDHGPDDGELDDNGNRVDMSLAHGFKVKLISVHTGL